MRIALYTSTALPKLGGQEMVVDGLARALVRRGHDVTVLAPLPRRRDVVQSVSPPSPYREVRHPRFVSTTWGVSAYGYFLRRLARRFGPFDVVHAHDAYPTGYLAVRERLAPVVITSHGGDLNAGNVRIVKPGVLDRAREALDGAAVLVSIGRFTTENYRRVLGPAALEKTVSIPNGVNVAELGNSLTLPAAADPADAPVLYLGRLHPRKGVDVIIRAVLEVPEAKLVVVGDGPERATLEQLASPAGERVRFAGRQVGAEKAGLLARALLVAMPSRTWEAFPVVVLEAAAAGKAVLASRVPGLEDLVLDGVTGRLLPPDDPDAWAAALRQVLADPATLRRWGETAQSRVAEFDWDRVVTAYEEVYRRAAAARC
ncbi:MAG: glycosyltransferase family 4 protein [Tepidisphaerales bacterium]